MISLYRDPQGKTVAIKIKPMDVPGTTADHSFDGAIDGQSMQDMQKKIKELESRVKSQQKQLDLYAERDGSLQISQEMDKSATMGSKHS